MKALHETGGGMTLLTAPAGRRMSWRTGQGRVASVAAVCLGAVAMLAAVNGADWRVPVLALVGGGIGFVLFQSTFGFAGSFRALIERRDATGFRAQALALLLSVLVFFPLLALGDFFGRPLTGFVTPVGVAFVIGAILFGIGMQIGGGCASGTLFALGGGNGRLLMTLAFFLVGSVVGAAHMGFWWSLPALPAETAQGLLGWQLALALNVCIFGLVASSGSLPGATERPNWRQLVTGPWPLMWGAAGLASLNALTLVLAGRPWGETAGFTLWGSKIAGALGFDVAGWVYWAGNPAPLSASVFADITSVMDFGIIAGAALAAGLGGRFALRLRVPPRAWAGAALGGFLMGYGARLSDGCNIGAYFSALASGSLSGWVWIAAALCGSVIGIRLRPLFDPDRA